MEKIIESCTHYFFLLKHLKITQFCSKNRVIIDRLEILTGISTGNILLIILDILLIIKKSYNVRLNCDAVFTKLNE